MLSTLLIASHLSPNHLLSRAQMCMAELVRIKGRHPDADVLDAYRAHRDEVRPDVIVGLALIAIWGGGGGGK